MALAAAPPGAVVSVGRQGARVRVAVSAAVRPVGGLASRLPAITVALALTPILVRSLRTSMISVLGSDYITIARAKGLTSSRVLLGHVLRNATVSSVTVLGVNIAYLIGSTLVVERVFALPGLGTLMLDAIFNRDFAVVQGVTMVFAVMVVVVNLLTDLSHAALDPRVKLA